MSAAAPFTMLEIVRSWAESDWIQTFSSRTVQPLNLRVEDVSIIDIAHALSNQCRFSGHVQTFYSVAEHCVRMSFLGDPQTAMWKLLHDASEAYLVDLPRPLKRSEGLGAIYKFAEHRAMFTIAEHFGLEWPEPEDVKKWDVVMLLTEQRDLMGRQAKPWRDQAIPLDEKIIPVDPVTARTKFLSRFVALGGTGDGLNFVDAALKGGNS